MASPCDNSEQQQQSRVDSDQDSVCSCCCQPDQSYLSAEEQAEESSEFGLELKPATVCDATRSESASSLVIVEEQTEQTEPSEPSLLEQEKELALLKRRYVLTELLDTERDYVTDLGKIVEGYLEDIRRQLVSAGVDDILTTGVVPASSQSSQEQQVGGNDEQISDQNSPLNAAIQQTEQVQTVIGEQSASASSTSTSTDWPQLPEALKDGKHKIIFGNIEAIYEFHRDHFLHELERCLEEPHKLGALFKRYERRLNMYVVYCQNKPRSEAIVSEHLDSYFEELRVKLGHKLQLPDLLIKPVQRIMKYQLLLKDILRYTQRAQLSSESNELAKAVDVMLVVPKAADDMMNVGRLEGFPGKLTAQGKLIKQGILLFCDITPMLAQLEAHKTQTGPEPTTDCSSSASSSASASTSGASLSAQLIGSSHMSDAARQMLSQLLSEAKLRERQTFLFEQTIIFSEVARKSSSSSWSSSSTSNKQSRQQEQQVAHPCWPHSHNSLGAAESCCSSQDCQLPASSCDRSFQPGSDLHHHHQLQVGCGGNNNQAGSQQCYSMPSYQYKNHLSINKVALIDKHFGPSSESGLLGELEADSRRFMLRSRDPSQENVIYLLQTGCAVERDDWVASIKSMLECQLDFLRALQSPIAYQRGLTQDGSQAEFSSLWNPELRKTLSNPLNSNKFHKRIPSLFSQTANERTGSVRVCSSSSSTSARLVEGSQSSVGQTKYLRFVRSKLSKSKLNSMLSLSAKDPPEVEQNSGQLRAELVQNQLLVASSAQVELLAHQSEQLRLDIPHKSLLGSISNELSNPNSAEVEEPKAVQQQTSSKKSSNFFQGFRYTLKGRRSSKQVGQAEEMQTTQTTSTSFSETQLQQSVSLTTISQQQPLRRLTTLGGSKKFSHKLLQNLTSTNNNNNNLEQSECCSLNECQEDKSSSSKRDQLDK